jgi:predicted protein tyrosine phosphatase
MTREELQLQCRDRVASAETLLEELKRAKQPMAHTEFAQRVGVSVQNLQTAKYMVQVVKRLRKHNAHFPSGAAGRPQSSEAGAGDSRRALRAHLHRMALEKESGRLDSERRIRQLQAKLDRLEAERALEPHVFPLAVSGQAANDHPFIEHEPEGACGVITAGAGRVRRLTRSTFLAGLIAIRGHADVGRVDPALDEPTTPRLDLEFEDLDEPNDGTRTATEADVLTALEFARGIRGDLLIHSWAGMGRAPAIALAIIADRLGVGREPEALASALSIEPHAVPNRLVIAHADKLLRRNGALLAALDDRTRRREDDRRARADRRDRILARLGVAASPNHPGKT